MTSNYHTFILLAFLLICFHASFCTPHAQAWYITHTTHIVGFCFGVFCWLYPHITFIFQLELCYLFEPEQLHTVCALEHASFSMIQGYPAQHQSITCYCSYGPSLPQAVELLLNRVIRLKSINPHLHLLPGSWQSCTHLSKKRNAPIHTHIVCACVRVCTCPCSARHASMWCLQYKLRQRTITPALQCMRDLCL